MTITQLDNGYILVPRGDWDNQVDFPRGKVATPVKDIFIHHTVTNPTGDPCADARTVERVLDQRKLDGYSYLAHPSGVMLEFAGHNRGEHTSNHNSTSFAISLIGNYDMMQPTLIQLVNCARTINLLRLGGFVHPDLSQVKIRSHADVKATACPGANMRVAKINNATGVDWIRWFAATGA